MGKKYRTIKPIYHREFAWNQGAVSAVSLVAGVVASGLSLGVASSNNILQALARESAVRQTARDLESNPLASGVGCFHLHFSRKLKKIAGAMGIAGVVMLSEEIGLPALGAVMAAYGVDTYIYADARQVAAVDLQKKSYLPEADKKHKTLSIKKRKGIFHQRFSKGLLARTALTALAGAGLAFSTPDPALKTLGILLMVRATKNGLQSVWRLRAANQCIRPEALVENGEDIATETDAPPDFHVQYGKTQIIGGAVIAALGGAALLGVKAPPDVAPFIFITAVAGGEISLQGACRLWGYHRVQKSK